jgi:cytochrome c
MAQHTSLHHHLRHPDDRIMMHNTSRSRALRLLAVATLACGVTAQAQPASQQALLQRHKCYDCHGDVDAKTGPSYADMAERYRGDARAAARLSSIIRNGARGRGPWHMPPHQEISKAEALRMARYILAVR